jgi:hypothetical protein
LLVDGQIGYVQKVQRMNQGFVVNDDGSGKRFHRYHFWMSNFDASTVGQEDRKRDEWFPPDGLAETIDSHGGHPASECDKLRRDSAYDA